MKRLLLLAPMLLTACAGNDTIYSMRVVRSGHGVASYYHEPQRVACGGGRFNPNALTTAHRSVPCNTLVRVTNTRNGASIVVRVNDRGPAKWTGRDWDLSRAAASKLGFITAGTTHIKYDILAD